MTLLRMAAASAPWRSGSMTTSERCADAQARSVRPAAPLRACRRLQQRRRLPGQCPLFSTPLGGVAHQRPCPASTQARLLHPRSEQASCRRSYVVVVHLRTPIVPEPGAILRPIQSDCWNSTACRISACFPLDSRPCHQSNISFAVTPAPTAAAATGLAPVAWAPAAANAVGTEISTAARFELLSARERDT